MRHKQPVRIQKKSWDTASRWMLAALLLVPLVPDFAAPGLAFGCLWFCVKFIKHHEYILEIEAIQVMLACLTVWRLIGCLYSGYFLGGFGPMFLWVLSLSGIVIIPMVLRDRKMMDKALIMIVLAGGIAGGIGIMQYFLYRADFSSAELKAELNELFNPFWHFINKGAAKLLMEFPEFMIQDLPRTEPIAIRNRANSTFTNPVFFACFEVLIFPIVFNSFFYFKSKKKKALAFVSSILILGGIAFSYSRGPYLALAVGVAILLFSGWRQLTVMLCAAPVFLVGFVKSGAFTRLLSSLNSQDVSVNTRTAIWDASFEILKNPRIFLFGMGTGVEPMRAVLLETYQIKQPHAHNLVLQLLIENGLIGLLLFAGILVAFLFSMVQLIRLSKEARGLGVSILAGVVGFCACGMTDYLFYGPTLVQYFFLMLGFAIAVHRLYMKESGRVPWGILLQRKQRKLEKE